ncbi:unnamed protein product, partial [Staurois parvus]
MDPSCLAPTVQAGGGGGPGVVDPSCLAPTVQAGGGFMVWWIHPVLYQWFRLMVLWCG